MTTVVNRGTQKADELISGMNYRHMDGTSLYDVYGTISKDKRDSWEKIRRECYDNHGENLHITGASSYTYSCIYAYPVTSETTGEIEKMVIRKHTKANVYELVLPIEEYNRLVWRK